MPVETEKEVAAYLQQTNKRLYDRLFLNRVIAGAITAISGTRPQYLVRLDTTGDAWHACYEPGYTPQIGDVVDLMWRDADTGYVLTPRSASAATATYMQIGQTITLTGDLGSVTYANIPQVFQTLKFFVIAQTSAATAQDLMVQFNGDTGSTYYRGWAWLDTAGNYANSLIAGDTAAILGVTTFTSSANWGVNEITIFDYAQNTRRISATFLSHKSNTGGSNTMQTVLGGVTWTANNVLTAINSVKFFPASGNFKLGSTFRLVGI